jgi:MFS family permease
VSSRPGAEPTPVPAVPGVPGGGAPHAVPARGVVEGAASDSAAAGAGLPGPSAPAPEAAPESILAVLANRRFSALWLAQVATQVGGNMVLYGLTILVFSLTRSNSAVSLLILTFLVPAVVFSAIAGVYVDNVDRRLLLVVTNLLRAAAFLGMFLVGGDLLFIYLLNVLVSTVTTFFAPAEAAMIPILVERRQLLPANGIFTFTLQASFAVGFALLGPLVVNLAGVPALLLFVAVLYFGAAALCWTLPSYAPTAARLSPVTAIGEAEEAVASTLAQLRGGLAYIRANRSIFWSLSYLGITASLIGVLGVLGPDFAFNALGLREQDFVVVVLPLGAGLVMGILLLNVYGRYLPRRRAIEGGLVGLAIALTILSVAGPISRFLQARAGRTGLVELGPLVSLLAIVVLLALAAGVAYAFVAVPAQTQLQEELPEDVRGRVFGVLNMLVSVASFLPIVVVGPVADLVGTPPVIFACGIVIGAFGAASIFLAQPLTTAFAAPAGAHAPVDPVAVATVPLPRSADVAPLPDGPGPFHEGRLEDTGLEDAVPAPDTQSSPGPPDRVPPSAQ